MTTRQIVDDEEFTRDWDWYAVDQLGAIGHFTTAGFRRLPGAIKGDLEAAEKCIHYFFDEAQVRTAYSVSDDLENEAGSFKNDRERQRYLQSFAQMAERGLFSFDTKPLGGGPGRYYLVASPQNPLRIEELPPEIAELVCRVRANRPFSAGGPHSGKRDSGLVRSSGAGCAKTFWRQCDKSREREGRALA